MMHIYMDLKEHGAILPDEEGVAVADLPAARDLAVKAARDVMSQGLADGTLSFRSSIIVRSGDGIVLLELPFGDAVALER